MSFTGTNSPNPPPPAPGMSEETLEGRAEVMAGVNEDIVLGAIEEKRLGEKLPSDPVRGPNAELSAPELMPPSKFPPMPESTLLERPPEERRLVTVLGEIEEKRFEGRLPRTLGERVESALVIWPLDKPLNRLPLKLVSVLPETPERIVLIVPDGRLEKTLGARFRSTVVVSLWRVLGSLFVGIPKKILEGRPCTVPCGRLLNILEIVDGERAPRVSVVGFARNAGPAASVVWISCIASSGMSETKSIGSAAKAAVGTSTTKRKNIPTMPARTNGLLPPCFFRQE